MKPRLAFLVLCATALLVGACAPLHWTRAGAVPEQVQDDAAECRQRAWQEATLWTLHAPPWQYGLGLRSHLWPHRPLASGFRSPLDDPFFQESRLAAFCMESKGYQLTPAPSR